MFKKSVLALMMATLATSAFANNPAPTIKADAPNRYVVKKGDTLWDIAGRYLDAPYRWRDIWATNKQVKNPNLIYPNDVLILCVIKGQTLVGVDTGEGCAGVEAQMTNTPKTVAVRPSDEAVTAIPLSAIRQWLDRLIVVSPSDFESSPYVLSSKNSNIVTGVGDKIYVKGAGLVVGQHYGVYKKGKPYVDPATRATIGLETVQVATGTVVAMASNGIASVQITESFGKEIEEGDRVFADIGNAVPPVFYLKPANPSRGGRVVRVNDSIIASGVGGIIAINMGAAEGLRVGDVLAVHQRGIVVRDVRDHDAVVRLPSEEIGLAMVFKTFGQISYAYVLNADQPIKEGDYLTAPSR